MIINNGILMRVEHQDIDANGKVVIPSGVKRVNESAFEGMVTITRIECMEGLEVVDGYALSDLPNLKSIKFPKSLRILGGEYGLGSIVFNNKGIEIEFQSYPAFSKYCLGKDETLTYIFHCFKKIEELLKTSSIENLSEAMRCYNSIICHKQFYKEENIKNEFDKISLLLITKLKEKDNDKEIGQTFIEKELKEGRVLTPALLQYDAYSVYDKLELEEYFKPIDFAYCQKTAMLVADTNEIWFDMNAMLARAKKLTGSKDVKPLDLNLLMMHALRHEISHLYQQTRAKDSKSELEQLAYLDHQVQLADEGYASGRLAGHIAEHDFLPDEIDADIKALSLLGKDLVKNYGFKENSTTKYIEKHKEKRMQYVYDKYHIRQDENFRIAILEEALDSGRLTKTESERIETLLNMYKELTSACKV